MIARHTITYLGSRGVAAALNLSSLAVFTRLVPSETYGTYLFALSWALVLYGATCQWPKFAFFALYEERRAAVQVGTVLRLLGTMLLLASACAAAAVALGLAEPRLAAAIVAATIGLTVFEGANEIARTRLAAEAVGLAVVLRAVLVLALGSLVLHATGDALDLVVVIALSNVAASLPALLAILPLVRKRRASLDEARRLLAYGWPLVVALGLTALAQSIDRLVVARSASVADLGSYGAVADVLRQSFIVFGESIAASLVAIAKRDARERGMAAARPVLCDAARAFALIAGFGAAFFLCFDEVVVTVLLGPDYREAAIRLTPLLVLASVCMMVRGYYFGQVIYFATSSRLEAVASGVSLVVIGGLALMLVPHRGVEGAAIAVAAGQALACLVFVLGARGEIRMPVPLADVAGILACAFAAGAALAVLEELPGASSPIAIGARFVLLGLAAAATAWRFNVAGLADGLTRRCRTVA